MLKFYKYQTTGNDFIIIEDLPSGLIADKAKNIEALCDRRLGVGADGVVFIQVSTPDGNVVKVEYYNNRGRQERLNANAARATFAFLFDMGLYAKDTLELQCPFSRHTVFKNSQGIHVSIGHVGQIELLKKNFLVDVDSSCHYIEIVRDLPHYNVYAKAQGVCNNPLYKHREISQVSYLEQEGPNLFYIRSYDKKLQDETFCNSEAAALVALCMYESKRVDTPLVDIGVLEGDLRVSFTPLPKGYSDVYVTGQVEFVFKGEIKL